MYTYQYIHNWFCYHITIIRKVKMGVFVDDGICDGGAADGDENENDEVVVVDTYEYSDLSKNTFKKS